MKKVRAGILVLLVAVCAGFFALGDFERSVAVNGSSGSGREGVILDSSITQDDCSINMECEFSTDANAGIYILRDENLIADRHPLASFVGELKSDFVEGGGGTVQQRYFDFVAVKKIDGVWYSAQEYARKQKQLAIVGDNLDGATDISGVVDWFYVDYENYVGAETFPESCYWWFPMSLDAGEYGIRARAMDRQVDRFVYIANGEGFLDYYFTILYAEDLKSITIADGGGDSNYNVEQNGMINRIDLSISGNSGAIKLDGIEKSQDGFTYGALDLTRRFYWLNPLEVLDNIVVTHNGKAVDTFIFEAQAETGLLSVILPELERGQYVISVRNDYNNRIVGTFVINNGEVKTSSLSAGETSLRVVGILLVVLGILGLIAGLFLVYGSKIAWAVNNIKYKRIEAKKYGTDAKSIRAREKAEKEKQEAIERGEMKKERKSGFARFSERLSESKRLRNEAEMMGITVEELKKIEAEQGNKEEIAKNAMKDARDSVSKIDMVETIAEEENLPNRKDPRGTLIVDDPTFVSGVAENDMTEKQPPSEGEPVTKPPTKPIAGGILGRIKKATEQEE